MPPRSCLAQKVTVRPRSAAASTQAKLPFRCGFGVAARELKDDPGQFAVGDEEIRAAADENGTGSSASRSRRDEFGQRLVAADQEQIGGAADAERGALGERRAGDALDAETRAVRRADWRQSSRMAVEHSCAEQNGQLADGAANVARADGENGVARARFLEQRYSIPSCSVPR